MSKWPKPRYKQVRLLGRAVALISLCIELFRDRLVVGAKFLHVDVAEGDHTCVWRNTTQAAAGV